MKVSIRDTLGHDYRYDHAKVDLLCQTGLLLIHDSANQLHTYILRNVISYTTSEDSD